MNGANNVAERHDISARINHQADWKNAVFLSRPDNYERTEDFAGFTVTMTHQKTSRPGRSPYITAGGFLALQKESTALWERRRVVTRALAAAAAEGDRSENAEYIYRKKELREIDRRLRYLQKRLPALKVVDEIPGDPERVFFGARVTLEDPRGNELSFRIVGSDEFDPARNWISVDSPMARAVLNREVDDKVVVQTPAGEARYLICGIEYMIA
jgi:transcription elongation factor GreB